MFKIYAGFGILIAFVGWIFYRLLIKKDLKEHFHELLAGLFFVGVWFLIYKLLIS